MFSCSPPRLLHRIAVLVVLRLLGKWPRVRGKQLTLEAKRKQTSHFLQDTVRELRKNNNTSCRAKAVPFQKTKYLPLSERVKNTHWVPYLCTFPVKCVRWPLSVPDDHAHTAASGEVALKVTMTSTIVLWVIYWRHVLMAHSEKLHWLL